MSVPSPLFRVPEHRRFEYLGGGVMSSVYATRDPDKVLKISSRFDDDGWVDYVAWAGAAGFQGSDAPVVHSFKTLTTPDGSRGYAAVIERLIAINSAILAYKFKCDLLEAYDHLSKWMHWGSEPVAKLAPGVARLLSPGVARFVDEYMTTFGTGGDLHPGNFMFRPSTGTIVVTDPLITPSVVNKSSGRVRSSSWRGSPTASGWWSTTRG